MKLPDRYLRFVVTIVAFSTLLTASPVLAGQDATLRRWDEEIRWIDHLLLHSEWKKARKKSQILLGEMIKRVVRGSGAREFLGQVLVRQAVAFSGAGEVDDAGWTMQVALQVLPSLREFPLDRYGQAGEELRHVSVRRIGEMPEFEEDRPQPLALDCAEIKPPKKIRGVNPQFPQAKRSGSAFNVVVEVVVGVDGVPRFPVITKADGEFTAVCALLNMMREWRYRPARLDDQPVEAFYNLTVRFNPGPENGQAPPGALPFG